MGTHRNSNKSLQSIRSLGNEPGFAGPRNRAFFGILAATGCRVNALRQLDGTDCLVLPNGRVRLYLHEKGKLERREVELSSDAMHDIHDYIVAFNHLAASRGWRNRVRLGEPGRVWRNEAGDHWSYGSLLKTLKEGCTNTGVTPFTPHALRRAFASDAASRLPRHIVALAGGWKGLERLDDHYVQPREPTIWEKLERHRTHNSMAPSNVETHDAATVPV